MDVHKSSVRVCARRRIKGGHFEVEESVFGTISSISPGSKSKNFRFKTSGLCEGT
jgi:hypothetical protein